MSTLDIDPPRLRLISSSGTADRNDRLRQAAPLSGEARFLYRQVLAAALADGDPIDPAALRVVLAVHQSIQGGAVRRFSAHGIWQLLLVDIIAWGRARRIELPEACSRATVRLIEYLIDSDGFDPASDSAHDLLMALDECTGGVADRPVASRRSRS